MEERRTGRAYIIGAQDCDDGFWWCHNFLQLRGYKPIRCDVANGRLAEYFTEEEGQKLEIDIISMCDAVIMVDGWQKDHKCNFLLSVAKSLGKKIYYQAYYDQAPYGLSTKED